MIGYPRKKRLKSAKGRGHVGMYKVVLYHRLCKLYSHRFYPCAELA